VKQFKKAIDRGDVQLVSEMLAENPALASAPITWGSVFNKCRTEPLHYLSDAPFNSLWNHGRQALLAKVLIEAGAPVDGLPTSGETPLHGAASLGEPTVAEVLLDHGANTEMVAKYPGIPDGTPLDFAVHFGMVEVVDLLHRRGAKLLSTPMAAGAGQLNRVQDEIESLRQNNEELLDVFRCAAVCDRIAIIQFLLANGLDCNADIKGATALHWAAWEAKPHMVKVLLDNGADPNIKDQRHNLTAHGWAKHRRKELGPRWGHNQVIALLESQGGGDT